MCIVVCVLQSSFSTSDRTDEERVFQIQLNRSCDRIDGSLLCCVSCGCGCGCVCVCCVCYATSSWRSPLPKYIVIAFLLKKHISLHGIIVLRRRVVFKPHHLNLPFFPVDE